MGADTWVNLVPSPPKAAKPSTPPKPSTPTEGRRADRVTTKDFGWFWIKKRNTSCSELRAFPPSRQSVERSTFEPGSPAHAPIRPSKDLEAALSRSQSGDSWLEVTREAASSEDLSDAEDGTLVAIAPRKGPRVRPLHLSSASGATPSTCASPVAPMPETMSQKIIPNEASGAPKGVRHRAGPDAGCGPALAMASPKPSTSLDEGSVSSTKSRSSIAPATRSAAVVCGVNTDSDLLWTFLAGMMLYFMSA